MTTHELKIWPIFFDDVVANIKTFEIRKLDRDFKVGDTLLLREWAPSAEGYTGRETRRTIEYILTDGGLGIQPGFCVMAVS